MQAEQKTLRQLTHEFFHQHPDYAFCRNLAFNIKSSVTTYESALEILAAKSRAVKENQHEIKEKLAQRAVQINGNQVRIKDLSLPQIILQENAILQKIVELHLKHPFAFGRTKKTRLLPRWIRTFFLSALLGHAKRRGLDLDYEAHFDMLTLL